ncbi:bactofilin family protein [Balneicella halophila]|nr:polymer-forming cytoskeletal protein [Balneicella halophila]
MYGKKNTSQKKHGNKNSALPAHGDVTILSEGTVIEGTLKVSGDVRIDGRIKGDIKGDMRVIVGDKAKIEGNVDCDFLELNGYIVGDVKCKKGAKLYPTAKLKGDLYAPEFSVEMGAHFIGASKGQLVSSEDLNNKPKENVAKK